MSVVRSKLISQANKNRILRPDTSLSIKDFCHKWKKVLIYRGCGGLGDIFMHRMIFEDFKRLMPECELHFACPKYYFDAVSDHPFIDHLVDSDSVDRDSYGIHYNTTTACGRREMKLAPLPGENRSDIWAAHCGVVLTKHEMHIRMTEEEKAIGKKLIENSRDRPGPTICVSPISAMQNKNLLEHQVKGLIDGLRDRNLYAFGLHSAPIWEFIKNDYPTVTTAKIRQWMAVIDQADYVVSVDSAAFHCAGGMKKPLVGIFTFADGKKYGMYYDFDLVQRHRDDDPLWTCGPCYNWGMCPKTSDNPKPCLTEITPKMILDAVDKMLEKHHVLNSNQ